MPFILVEDRQCTCNITAKRVRVNSCRRKATSITYSVCLSVVFVIKQAKCVRRVITVNYGLSGSTVFLHIISCKARPGSLTYATSSNQEMVTSYQLTPRSIASHRRKVMALAALLDTTARLLFTLGSNSELPLFASFARVLFVQYREDTSYGGAEGYRPDINVNMMPQFQQTSYSLQYVRQVVCAYNTFFP